MGDDVSPDFYGWVFPKYDHVAVGTGTVVNKTAIKQYQQATRDRAKVPAWGRGRVGLALALRRGAGWGRGGDRGCPSPQHTGCAHRECRAVPTALQPRQPGWVQVL